MEAQPLALQDSPSFIFPMTSASAPPMASLGCSVGQCAQSNSLNCTFNKIFFWLYKTHHFSVSPETMFTARNTPNWQHAFPFFNKIPPDGVAWIYASVSTVQEDRESYSLSVAQE